MLEKKGVTPLMGPWNTRLPATLIHSQHMVTELIGLQVIVIIANAIDGSLVFNKISDLDHQNVYFSSFRATRIPADYRK